MALSQCHQIQGIARRKPTNPSLLVPVTSAHVANTFVLIGLRPLVLHRKSSSQSKSLSSFVTIAKVDEYDVTEKHSVEVIILTLGGSMSEVEYVLAEVAKKGGVKLFVPSGSGLVLGGMSRVEGMESDRVLAGLEG
ncbi:hypothetical protein WG66_010960 [Moniliophthora roreri]|nr:hypothetical protein WG66_010960 [Moniliophthora roreri]